MPTNNKRILNEKDPKIIKQIDETKAIIFNISKIILLSYVSDNLPIGYWNKAPMKVFTKTSIEIWKILKSNLAPKTAINPNDAP